MIAVPNYLSSTTVIGANNTNRTGVFDYLPVRQLYLKLIIPHIDVETFIKIFTGTFSKDFITKHKWEGDFLVLWLYDSE